ncbi:kunitz-type protease inhibitor 1b isoform X1 [Oncorhynchus tshawytscha]|uniref:Kunitz-type protease inhibitor 1-like n=1 Tax=Oncorhynchus tshawytscha TaxID=74940 RepID=A0AAZ3SR14_ONCTS|nr:kunitz-type protease inhibitor 1b isoform X1 [Oncorhynchus tshawytscha]
MTALCIGSILGSALLLLSIVCQDNAQVTNGEGCAGNFNVGNVNFVLDTEDSVKVGASFISSPTVTQAEDCVDYCCQNPNCNLALIENGAEKGSVKTCFLFNCLYKREYVCRFVNKVGFTNYILDSVYEDYLGGPESTRGKIKTRLTPVPGDEDKFPTAKAGRDIVVQPNDTVTLNGIESWDDKVITSYKWSLVKGDSTVDITKTDLKDQVMLSNLKPGMYVFQLKVTDSSNQSAMDKVSVLVLTPEQSEGHCLVPKKVGHCRGAFPRWHYNGASEKCEEFIFGGCKGNRNNYLSLQECSDACHDVSAASGRSIVVPEGEVCGSPCNTGQFTCDNGCCLDEDLECDTVTQCSDGSDEASCDKLNQTFTRLLNIHVDKSRARCTEPPRTGPCRASHSHWYYDPLNRKCNRFTYGGCDGNDNNFDVEESCKETCKGVTEHDVFARGMFERYEEEESESGSIAIAIVLSVAILVVLAALGYCFLKHRKDRSQHQPVATNVPHVAFEERDTLVYNTTTKPV